MKLRPATSLTALPCHGHTLVGMHPIPCHLVHVIEFADPNHHRHCRRHPSSLPACGHLATVPTQQGVLTTVVTAIPHLPSKCFCTPNLHVHHSTQLLPGGPVTCHAQCPMETGCCILLHSGTTSQLPSETTLLWIRTMGTACLFATPMRRRWQIPRLRVVKGEVVGRRKERCVGGVEGKCREGFSQHGGKEGETQELHFTV